MHGPRRRHRRGAQGRGAGPGPAGPARRRLARRVDNSAIGYPVRSRAEDPVPESPAGFTTRRTLLAQFEADRRAGNGTDFWMNPPYLDVPDDNVEKALYYRWWLLRYNYLDADIPGNDYRDRPFMTPHDDRP